MPGGTVSLYILLWFLGIYLRLTMLIVPPLIPRLEAVLGFSTAQVALTMSTPALLIAGCALIGGWLVGRLGAVPTVAAGLVVIAVGSSLRSVPGGFVLFLAATAVMGAGIALMQTGMPTLAQAWIPARVGRATAVYSNGLLSGELISAALTGPLVTHVLSGHWLWAFTVWAIPVPLVVVALLRRGAHPARSQDEAPRPRITAPLSWRDPLIWKIALLLGSAGGLYLSGNVFLAPILAASGRGALLDACLGTLNGFQLISSGLLVLYADRLLGRRWPLLAATGGAIAMVPAMLWLPGHAVILAAGLFGFSTSSMLIFGLALPAWLVPPKQIARLAAGSFAAGNAVVFLAPAIAGWVKDVTGLVSAGFVPVIALALLSMAVSGGLHPRREH